MKRWNLSHYAISGCVTAAMLAGCSALPSSFLKGQGELPVGAAVTTPQRLALAARNDSGDYRILYGFRGRPDGAVPFASMVDIKGTLYGTTYSGGTHGDGTVFGITTGGTEKVLYNFKNVPDGADPESLVDIKGILYGTTYSGGAYRKGTVFVMTTQGVERVLHSFGADGVDGGHPAAPLIEAGGTFYGTTAKGGALGMGTVFSIAPDGREKLLHSFGRGTDGAFPYDGLTDVGGTLYGTTYRGGAKNRGTVFSITRSGTERVLHSFGHRSDGVLPDGSLIPIHPGDRLYGTTIGGGRYDTGTLFSITTSGTEKVLYSFGYPPDGVNPYGGLVEMGGTFYGTTYSGGIYKIGTIFSITTSGLEKVLHDFDGADGFEPRARLLNVAGVLYGTTTHGGKPGCHAVGCGTVFALSP